MKKWSCIRSKRGCFLVLADVVGFDNETAMVDDFMKCLNANPHTKPTDINTCIKLAGIVFQNTAIKGSTKQHITYKIRLRWSLSTSREHFVSM